jgi:hypothetical protein
LVRGDYRHDHIQFFRSCCLLGDEDHSVGWTQVRWTFGASFSLIILGIESHLRHFPSKTLVPIQIRIRFRPFKYKKKGVVCQEKNWKKTRVEVANLFYQTDQSFQGVDYFSSRVKRC